MKRILALLLCVVMCLSLAVTAFAAEPTLVVELDKTEVNQSAADQNVVLNVKLSAATTISSIQFEVELSDGLELVSIEPGDSKFTFDNVNLTTGIANRTSHILVDGVSNIAKITVKVPANIAIGTYSVTVKNVEIGRSTDDAAFISDGTATRNVEVKDPNVYVTGVSLNKSTLSLGVGRNETLVATVAPSNATNKSVTWSSLNESVATVDQNGKVTGHAFGVARITVTTADGSKTATCDVTVTPNEIVSFTLSADKTTINFNDSTTIRATVNPSDWTDGENGDHYEFKWSVNDSSLATLTVSGTKDTTPTLTAKKVKGTVTVVLEILKKNVGGDTLDTITDEIEIKITEGLDEIIANIIDDDMKFRDVSRTDYFYRPVAWAVSEGITDGLSRYTFAPDMDCTRAQTVTFLWRAAGCPAPRTTSNPFTDVNVTDYYYDAVLWAVENGITNGTSATTFSPNATVTRAEVVTFLWRAEGEPGASMSGVFTDVPAGAYYAEAVAWAVDMGITEGVSSSSFAPNAACTRAQIVTFLYRNR